MTALKLIAWCIRAALYVLLLAACYQEAHAAAPAPTSYELATCIYKSSTGHNGLLHDCIYIERVPYPTEAACSNAAAYADTADQSGRDRGDLSVYLADYYCLPVYGRTKT